MSESKFEIFRFLFHFRSTLGACISRNMGPMSVPMADMALSDVIEQILNIWNISIFWPFSANFGDLYLAKYGSYVSSDGRYGFIRFSDHFRPTFRAYILWDKGWISVPMADLALSDVIEQLWGLYLMKYESYVSSDGRYGFIRCHTANFEHLKFFDFLRPWGITAWYQTMPWGTSLMVCTA